MNILNKPQPQAFATPYLRNRTRVTADTPDYTALCWRGQRRPSDVDRLVYRDSRGVLCLIPYAAVIEFSRRGTLVLIAEHDGRPVPQYQQEAYRTLNGPDRSAQRAVVCRAGDEASQAATRDSVALCAAGGAVFIEEKQATEPLSEGESRMLAGLQSGQPQQVWRVSVRSDGQPYAATCGTATLNMVEFRRYIEIFGGFA